MNLVKPLLTLAVTSLLAGCPTKPDPLYCGVEGHDCNRPDEIGDKNFCDIDKLYGAEGTFQCVARPDADACNRAEPCTSDAKPHCDDISEGVKGTCVQCVNNDHCPGGECDADTNTCFGFSCAPGGEGDATCAAVSGDTPRCVATDTCGECLESPDCQDAAKPICNTETFECESGCSAHDECDSGACDFDSKECEEEDGILYVATGGSTNAGCGDPGDECATIVLALNEVNAGRNIIVIAAGEYDDVLEISSGTVTLIGEAGAKVTPDLSVGTNALKVSGGNVTLDGLNVAPDGSAGTDAVLCQNASLSLTRLTVEGARDIGIIADDCTLTLSQSIVQRNTGGGIDLNNSDFTITNNFIAYNGSSGTTHAGIDFRGGGTPQDFNFNTVVGNQVNTGGVSGLSCNTVTPVAAVGNIIYSDFGISLSLANNCTHTYSDIKGSTPGTGNIDVDPDLINDSAINGDFHLASGSPCINAAAAANAPAVDIDGDTRPLGSAPDMGADEAE